MECGYGAGTGEKALFLFLPLVSIQTMARIVDDYYDLLFAHRIFKWIPSLQQLHQLNLNRTRTIHDCVQ